MLDARNRTNEDVAHAHRLAGIAKAEALAPKTPGRRGILLDENTAFKTAQGQKADALQTPAPRNRAPLGAKTTNAKAKASTTPAPLALDTKVQDAPNVETPAHQRALSARKHRLRVHRSPRTQISQEHALQNEESSDVTAEAAISDDDLEPPEIETCNRLAEPDMPDIDEECTLDHNFHELKPENIMRGVREFYWDPIGEDGLSKLQREEKRRNDETEAWMEDYEKQLTERSRKIDWEELDRLCGFKPKKNLEIQRGVKAPRQAKATSWARKPPSEADSSAAASALSTGPRSTQQRSASIASSRFAAPTAASQAKQATIAKSTSHDSSDNPTRAPRSAIPIASRTTIGHARGRQISAEIRGGKPRMADRRRPNPDVPRESKSTEGHPQHEDILQFMQRQYAERDARLLAAQADLDDNNLADLQAALDESTWLDLQPGFQLPMPEGCEPLV